MVEERSGTVNKNEKNAGKNTHEEKAVFNLWGGLGV